VSNLAFNTQSNDQSISVMVVTPVKWTTVANGGGRLPVCLPTDLERPAGWRNVCRIVIHISSATQNSPFHESPSRDYFLDWTPPNCCL